MKNRIIALFSAAVLCFGICLPQASALQIRAESAFVMDGNTGEELYADQADQARVPASMTKVLTAYITYQEMAPYTGNSG